MATAQSSLVSAAPPAIQPLIELLETRRKINTAKAAWTLALENTKIRDELKAGVALVYYYQTSKIPIGLDKVQARLRRESTANDQRLVTHYTSKVDAPEKMNYARHLSKPDRYLLMLKLIKREIKLSHDEVKFFLSLLCIDDLQEDMDEMDLCSSEEEVEETFIVQEGRKIFNDVDKLLITRKKSKEEPRIWEDLRETQKRVKDLLAADSNPENTYTAYIDCLQRALDNDFASISGIDYSVLTNLRRMVLELKNSS